MDVTSFVLGLKKGAEGNLKTQEKAVTVVENGVTEILPDTGYALSKVLMNVNVPTGGGCAQFTEYLAETTFTNTYQEGVGAFAYLVEIEASVAEAWFANTKPVTVVYDGEEFSCAPQLLTEVDGSVGVGNLATFGGTANGEPFAVAIMGLDGGYCFLIGSTVDMAPTQHTVCIYQEVSGGGNLKTQEKTVDIRENGTSEVLPDEGYALSKVTMNVNVPTDGGNSYAEELVNTFLGRTDVTGMLDFTALKDWGNYGLTTLPSYAFAGFCDVSGNGVEGMVFSKVGMVLPEAFAQNKVLKVLDFTLHPQLTSIGFFQQCFAGCTALESVIIRDGGAGVASAVFHKTTQGYSQNYAETGVGANSTFKVYVPKKNLATVKANVTSNSNSSLAASRFYAIEDYPDIDNWRDRYTDATES